MGMRESESVVAGEVVTCPGGGAQPSANETASGSPVNGKGRKRREIPPEEAARLLALGDWYLNGSADDPPPFEHFTQQDCNRAVRFRQRVAREAFANGGDRSERGEIPPGGGADERHRHHPAPALTADDAAILARVFFDIGVRRPDLEAADYFAFQ